MRRYTRIVFTFVWCLPLLKAQPTTPTRLSLDDAIQRGLKNNLSVLERETANRVIRAERLRALAALLPTVTANMGATGQQTNLAVFGFNFPGVPSIIGPFQYVDARANASMDLYNRATRKSLQAAAENVRAADLGAQDTRDLVVQAVANAYLTIVASGARVEAARVEVATARALYDRAKDLHTAGISPAIDELRAQVELQARQQQLLAAENNLAKDKLALAQVIGWPAAQPFELADAAPYAPLDDVTPEQMMDRALTSRADYRSLKSQLQSAELSRQAALAERMPTARLNGDYGVNGRDPSQLHGTFSVSGSIRFTVFDGGRIRADVAQADAAIQQRKDEIADLENRIGVAVRMALLDLRSAADQVAVARSSLDVADQTLTQARDRFSAGVTDTIEVVQAQDSLANARERVIGSMYAHNLAKVALARAIGMTEMNLKQFMGGKP